MLVVGMMWWPATLHGDIVAATRCFMRSNRNQSIVSLPKTTTKEEEIGKTKILLIPFLPLPFVFLSYFFLSLLFPSSFVSHSISFFEFKPFSLLMCSNP